MRNVTYKSIALSTILIVILFLGQQQLSTQRPLPLIKISKQESAINFSDELIQIFSTGQSRLISSLIWIETLMESDLDHYGADDLGSWMFLRFNTLNRIDPYFYEVYRYGGQYLSIVKNDRKGATQIYERGLKLFPEKFWLNYHAAFHYYFELNNYKRAIPLFEKIAFTKEGKRIAPFLSSLISRLRLKHQYLSEESYLLAEHAYRQLPKDSNLGKRLYRRLYAIRCQLDLACLNGKGRDCRTRDLDGIRYISHNGTHGARNPRRCNSK